jgi:hypothetical protein
MAVGLASVYELELLVDFSLTSTFNWLWLCWQMYVVKLVCTVYVKLV